MPVIYFDYAATTPVCPQAVDAVVDALALLVYFRFAVLLLPM